MRGEKKKLLDSRISCLESTHLTWLTMDHQVRAKVVRSKPWKRGRHLLKATAWASVPQVSTARITCRIVSCRVHAHSNDTSANSAVTCVAIADSSACEAR